MEFGGVCACGSAITHTKMRWLVVIFRMFHNRISKLFLFEFSWRLGFSRKTGKVKLLGINIDNQLKFDHHVLNLCAKANQKLSALTRMARFLSFEKRRTLFKAFFESQFKYSPLIWMFYGRQANVRINQLHKRALRLVYNDFISSFEDLLEKDGFFTVHHSNVEFLTIELYKGIQWIFSWNYIWYIYQKKQQ